ncbi:hypothetical protein [Aureivirga sp. CE67]|uniref:hypothetical protein n=1 Tax=Aureivirga sp. CE67 TaxID=1788983 RepID=UPI0018CA1750|nr:hypothetical protein [Aureivirga sp. CE67]
MKKTITLILLLFSISIFAQKKVIDQNELMSDLWKWNKHNDNDMTGTLWIPSSYWRIALTNSPDVTPETIDLIEESFKDYVLICALKMEQISNGTNVRFDSEEIIRKNILIKDINGRVFKPIPDEEVELSTRMLLSNLKPFFAQTLGKMGQGMHFYIFEVKDSSGVNIINEYEEGEFSVLHSGNEVKWDLPLSSLIDDKICPIDNEAMNGKWKFCPFHGNELK